MFPRYNCDTSFQVLPYYWRVRDRILPLCLGFSLKRDRPIQHRESRIERHRHGTATAVIGTSAHTLDVPCP